MANKFHKLRPLEDNMPQRLENMDRLAEWHNRKQAQYDGPVSPEEATQNAATHDWIHLKVGSPDPTEEQDTITSPHIYQCRNCNMVYSGYNAAPTPDKHPQMRACNMGKWGQMMPMDVRALARKIFVEGIQQGMKLDPVLWKDIVKIKAGAQAAEVWPIIQQYIKTHRMGGPKMARVAHPIWTIQADGTLDRTAPETIKRNADDDGDNEMPEMIDMTPGPQLNALASFYLAGKEIVGKVAKVASDGSVDLVTKDGERYEGVGAGLLNFFTLGKD